MRGKALKFQVCICLDFLRYNEIKIELNQDNGLHQLMQLLPYLQGQDHSLVEHGLTPNSCFTRLTVT